MYTHTSPFVLMNRCAFNRLRNCPTAKLPLLPCASSSLAAEGVAKIEEETRRMATVPVVPVALPACAPSELMPALRMAMSSVAKHDWVLGDRVVSVRAKRHAGESNGIHR